MQNASTVVPYRPQKANSWFWSFQQWHLCRPSYNCLSNSYRIIRWLVTERALVWVQRQRWTIVI